MTSAVTTKSGKGLSYGVVSELATYWNVLPGHEDELRAATQRFADVLSKVPPEKNIHTGLRDSRHVIFDNGTRLMWATTFENDWGPYFDDFVMIGIEHFLDWMRHTAQYTDVSAWVESSGGAEKFHRDNPELEAQMKQTVGGLAGARARGPRGRRVNDCGGTHHDQQHHRQPGQQRDNGSRQRARARRHPGGRPDASAEPVRGAGGSGCGGAR
jgi:hypothetical protein